LQGNIGDDSQYVNHRYQPAENLALSVAGGDEIGNGSYPVNTADTQDFLYDQPAQGRHEGGTEIGCQEEGAGTGRHAHAAVKRPGRTVDGKGKGVDIRVADQAAAFVSAPVTP